VLDTEEVTSSILVSPTTSPQVRGQFRDHRRWPSDHLSAVFPQTWAAPRGAPHTPPVRKPPRRTDTRRRDEHRRTRPAGCAVTAAPLAIHEPAGAEARAAGSRPGEASATPSQTQRVQPARTLEQVAQLVIMLVIGTAAGAGSFTHVHDVAATHGQAGWLAWSDAIVLELMSIAAGLELRRRKRTHTTITFPATVTHPPTRPSRHQPTSPQPKVWHLWTQPPRPSCPPPVRRRWCCALGRAPSRRTGHPYRRAHQSPT
jgi:hypothetical protein